MKPKLRSRSHAPLVASSLLAAMVAGIPCPAAAEPNDLVLLNGRVMDPETGYVGVGVGPAYMERGLTSYEQFEAQRTAARYGRLAAVHSPLHLSSQTPTEGSYWLES